MKIEKRLDVPKIKARIKELEAKIRAGKAESKEKQRAFSKASKGFSVYDRRCPVSWKNVPHSNPKTAVYTERTVVTALYSMRAHMRGKLHFKKRWVEQSNGRFLSEPWTMEKQYELFAHYLAEFIIEEVAEGV